MPGPTLAELHSESAADTMRSVMAEFSGGDTPSATPAPEAPATPEPESPVVEAKPPPTTIDSRLGGRKTTLENRDPANGRFTPKFRDGSTAEKAVAASGTAAEGVVLPSPSAATKPQAEAGAADAAPAPAEPPPEWSAEEQTAFRALPPPAQKLVLDRATAASEATKAATAVTQKFGAIESILAPRRDAFARDGMDDTAAVRQIFALSDFAAQKPVDFLRWFAQARGIDLRQATYFADGQQQQAEPPPLDPALGPFVQKLGTIEQQLAQITLRYQTEAQQRAAQDQAAIKTELQTFAEAKDAAGRTQRPYFNEVKALMGTFIGQGQAPDLQTAYDMATRAHPGVYAKIEAARIAEAAQSQAKAAREKAAAAKQAGSSIAGTPSDRARPEPTGDIRDQMKQMFAERGLM